MMVIDIGKITDLDRFKEKVDDLLRKVKESPTAPGFEEILIPGEPERRSKEKRLRDGVYIEDKTWGDIVVLAEELGVPIPEPIG
jgi:LDH2 family malate/lactate/ureidoglycolate dehydrogenase